MFTVGKERVLPYTMIRIVDASVGVLVALLFALFLPTKCDRENGLSVGTFWLKTKKAFRSYKNRNQDIRKKEEENFGIVERKREKRK